jgi:hypothetical protein
MKFASMMTAAALVLGTVAAPAVAQDYAAERVKKSVGTADLLAVVGSLGHQALQEGEDGQVLILVESDNQLKYLMLGTACDVNEVAGCQGVLIQAQFDVPPGTTYESVAKANLDFAALNVWVDFEQKSLGFTRYVVLDHGVTMANIRENVLILLALIEEAYPVAAGEQ